MRYVVNMLHMLSYGQQGGGGGGCDHVLDECNTGPTEKMDTNVHAAQEKPAAYKKNTLGLTAGHGVIMSPRLSLWPWLCRKHFGTDLENGWMIWWMFAWET